MAELFDLQILTPEREFYSGSVEAVTLMLSDGSCTVLAKHAPMTAAVVVCDLKIKENGGVWRDAAASEGFIEVRRDGVSVFLQTCEWPHEIDARRAEEARLRAVEHLRQKQSMAEYKQTRLQLARAMERLRISSKRGDR